MAYRKRNYRKKPAYRRRKFARKPAAQHKNKFTRAVLPGIGIPQALNTKLKYVESIQIADAVAANKIYVYRANSCNDIDLTGAGHQPMYYDQIGALYNRFFVGACTCVFKIVNTSSQHLKIHLTTGRTAATGSYDAEREDQSSKSVILGPSGSGNDQGKLTMSRTTSQVYGKDNKRDLYDMSGYTPATSSTDPAVVWNYILNVATLNGSALGTDGVRVESLFIQDVRFYERVKITQS